MNKILLALSLSVLILLAACGSEESVPDPTPTPSPAGSAVPAETPVPTPAPTPTPEIHIDDYQWGSMSTDMSICAEDGTPVLNLNLVLPQVYNPHQCPPSVQINEWYSAEMQSRIGEAEQYAEDMKADYEISQTTGLPFEPVTQEMSFLLTRLDDTVISVRRELYINFGGPHPNIYRLSEQFDPKTGSKLGFSDFFSDPDAVINAAVESLAIENGFTTSQITAAFQPENFYFTDDGCTFWVQGGQFPGVNSPLEATIPYKDLEAWMNHG